jgi:hypothetical protein
MAKQNVLAILVHFCTVAWIQSRNYRKDYGNTETLKNSLAQNEWVHDNSVPVYLIDKNNPEHAADLQKEMELRQATWDTVKNAADKEGLVKREVFEQLYVKNGKLVEPEYFGNAGFRRASVFYAAMVQRWVERAKPGHESDTISGLIPVRPVVYEKKVDLIIDQQQENELQTVGAKKMDDLEKVGVAHFLFMNGAREMDVRRLYPGSTGQKLFGLCMADNNWPRLKIIERLGLTAAHPDRIKWSPIRHDDLIKFNNRYEADRKRAEGLDLNEKQRVLDPITEGEVDQYFRDKSKGEGDGNAAKIAPKKDMEQYAKSHRLLLARKVFDSVLNNTQNNLSKYIQNADFLNAGVELIDGGNGAVGASALEAVKKDALLMAKVAEAVLKGKSAELTAAVDSILNPPKPVEQKPVEQKSVEQKTKVAAGK